MKQNVQIAGNGSAIPTPPEEPGRRSTTAQPNSASASTTEKRIQGGNMMIPPLIPARPRYTDTGAAARMLIGATAASLNRNKA